jgi:hypothetical protein
MTETSLAGLMSALDMVVFERAADGSFSPVAPPPPWFQRLARDTFPFLGHMLEDATRFWSRGAPGAQDFGPCAEVDEAGVEFHYKVTAVNAGDRRYLLFQLDRDSDRLRMALQSIRTERLEQSQGNRLLTHTLDALHAAGEIHTAVIRLKAATSPGQHDDLTSLSAQSSDLVRRLGELAREVHAQSH